MGLRPTRGCRPEEEVVLDTSLQSLERILDEKGLEELDKILGIVHGEPFTEKRSQFHNHLPRPSSFF